MSVVGRGTFKMNALVAGLKSSSILHPALISSLIARGRIWVAPLPDARIDWQSGFLIGHYVSKDILLAMLEHRSADAEAALAKGRHRKLLGLKFLDMAEMKSRAMKDRVADLMQKRQQRVIIDNRRALDGARSIETLTAKVLDKRGFWVRNFPPWRQAGAHYLLRHSIANLTGHLDNSGNVDHHGRNNPLCQPGIHASLCPS